MNCTMCSHNREVKAGQYKNVPYELTPCAGCKIEDRSAYSRAYNEEREECADTPVCEAGDPFFDEPVEEMMPVWVMTAVIALLLSLPERTFRVVGLRHQKKTFVEISKRVGASVASVEVLLRRAMRKHPELKALFPVKAAKQERRRARARMMGK